MRLEPLKTAETKAEPKKLYLKHYPDNYFRMDGHTTEPTLFEVLEDGKLNPIKSEDEHQIENNNNCKIFNDSTTQPLKLTIRLYENFLEVGYFYRYYKYMEKPNIVLRSTFVSNLVFDFKTGISYIKYAKKIAGKIKPKYKGQPHYLNITLYNDEEVISLLSGLFVGNNFFKQTSNLLDDFIKNELPEYYSKKYPLNLMNWFRRNNICNLIKELEPVITRTETYNGTVCNRAYFTPDTLKLIKKYKDRIKDSTEFIKSVHELCDDDIQSANLMSNIIKVKKSDKQELLQSLQETAKLIDGITFEPEPVRRGYRPVPFDETLPF